MVVVFLRQKRKNKLKIGVIGIGTMGQAILSRLLGSNSDFEILASSKKRGYFRGIKISSDNQEIAKKSNIIILAVKPQSLEKVIDDIRSEINERKLLISIIAGRRIDFFETNLNCRRVVRVMPNLAIKTGDSLSVFKLSDSCNDEDRKTTEKILDCFGGHLEVFDENLLDVTTAISGSGIAYFLKIISIFTKSATESGMDEKLAEELVVSTVLGASKLIENTDISYGGLINLVASKGGTTEAGLKQLEENNFEEILNETINKTVEKCKKLGGGN